MSDLIALALALPGFVWAIISIVDRYRR